MVLAAHTPQSQQSPSFSSTGLSALDDRLGEARPGAVIVRAAPAAGDALLSYVARKLSASGVGVATLRRHAGASMFRELMSQLASQPAEIDPARCAEQVAVAAMHRRVALVLPRPPQGTWDSLVAAELAPRARTLIVFFEDETSPVLSGEVFHVETTLDDADKARWYAAIALDAQRVVASNDILELEAWWKVARRTRGDAADVTATDVPMNARDAVLALGLVGRAWPRAHAALLAPEASWAAGMEADLVSSERGWLALDPSAERAGASLAAGATACVAREAAAALDAVFGKDPWALERAAELWLGAGDVEPADAAHARSLSLLGDTTARRELVSRWFDTVAETSGDHQLVLRTRAATRALEMGEADEALRWAQGAANMGVRDDATLLLLLGRAKVGTGDFVAARVALQRALDLCGDAEVRGHAIVELAEIAYQSGDLRGARDQAGALADEASPVQLRARNILGKVLLAEGRWDDADRHFAEDALVASAAGDRTGELRARLNRGIALLSKGLVDDARAILKDVLKDAEAAGDARAQAITLHNLSVIAMGRREYMSALGLLERTVSLRQRLGDRVRLAQILANLAELRLKLGLVDHADHAIAFGRRLLGPGMPPGRAAEFGAAAARVLLARQHSVDARREIATAIVDAEASGDRELLAEAHGIAARVALDDGDVTRATDAIARAQELATKPELVAELAILACQNARAQGAGDVDAGRAALGLAQATGDAELTCEAHAVLAALHADARDLETARAHHARAVGLRDQIAQGLDGEVRSAFLARRDMAQLGRMASQLVDREDEGPRTQRSPSSVPPSSQPRFREMVGEDPAIRSLVASIKKVARSNSTVLVHGESGTGKELVAEALHRASDRADGPFVAVNCAALVETLLLSELFGHEKGAFTGASARRRGRFEMAEGGTLFLDEIGDISPRTQVALLRVLQEKTFERVGGVAPIRANVRVVCATHRDLKAMVERGEFREDLYYRLRGITLEVPPLRSRPGDLPKIAEHLLARIADERAEAPKALAPDAIDLLVRHRWQGNVRELENVLRAVALFADDQVILASDLIENVDDFRELARSSAAMGGPPSVPPPPSSPLAARMYADSLPSIPAPPASLPEISGDDEDGAPLPEDEANATAVAYAQVRQGAVSLADMKRQIERDCIARALAETKGNITKAAALLGMKRPRLSQLVKQYGLTAVSTEGP